MDINILQISNSDCSVMQQSVNIGHEEVHMSYIEFQNVKKIYKMGDVKIKALNGADFSIEKGEFAVIAGASGAGKSTILNLMGGMDTATTGKIIVDKENVSKFSAKKLTTYRRYDIGFVFQFYNLVQNLTVRENVELATQICKNPLDIDEVIEAVGLKDRSSNFPSQLSGGEQQRVAIARAIRNCFYAMNQQEHLIIILGSRY